MIKSLYRVDRIRITLKMDAENDAIDIAGRVKRLASRSKWTSREFLIIARLLMKGEGWEPEVHFLDIDEINAQRNNGPLEFEITELPDEYAEQARRWKEVHELIEKGAVGDAEAAIEYCRRLKAGEITYGPYAGGPAS